MGVISTRKRTDPGDDWLGGQIKTKPLKVVAIALAYRMARAIWAMLRTGEAWRGLEHNELGAITGLTELARAK